MAPLRKFGQDSGAYGTFESLINSHMMDISFQQFKCGDQCSLTQVGLKDMTNASPDVIGLPLAAI